MVLARGERNFDGSHKTLAIGKAALLRKMISLIRLLFRTQSLKWQQDRKGNAI